MLLYMYPRMYMYNNYEQKNAPFLIAGHLTSKFVTCTFKLTINIGESDPMSPALIEKFWVQNVATCCCISKNDNNMFILSAF